MSIINTEKICSACGGSYKLSYFYPSTNPFLVDSRIPICQSCAEVLIKRADGDWNTIDSLCQLCNIPFLPDKWDGLWETFGEKAFSIYLKTLQDLQYDKIDWSQYNKDYLALKEKNQIGAILPLFTAAERHQMIVKWGANYDDEQLYYFENLYKGIITTQNITNYTQQDQLLKFCKLSLQVEDAIRNADPRLKDIISSYKALVDIIGLTPKNSKSTAGFDSAAELFTWLEKRGWVDEYYDGVMRDEVDLTMKNTQAFARRLYTQEPGMSDAIEARITRLENISKLENDTDKAEDDVHIISDDTLDKYSVDVFQEDEAENFEEEDN